MTPLDSTHGASDHHRPSQERARMIQMSIAVVVTAIHAGSRVAQTSSPRPTSSTFGTWSEAQMHDVLVNPAVG